jgi:type VI secretion system protein VasD
MADLLGAAALLTTLALGCGGADRAVVEECPPIKAARITLAPSDRLNPDDQGRALPTVVRLYQLTDLARLETAEFEDIWLRADETLEKELVKHDEITLYPGKGETKLVEVGEGVRFVVAVGLFRNPAGTSWRDVWELPASRCGKPDKADIPRARFEVEDYRIELVVKRARGGTKGR